MKQILLSLLLFTCITSAQKSAPVSGDAATLLDLLNKDYSGGNPENIQEDIAKDRSKVIAIFKACSKNLSTNVDYKEIGSKRSTYFKTLEAYNAQVGKNEFDDKTLQAIEGIKKILDTEKEKYYTSLQEGNDKELSGLSDSFAKDSNEYLVIIIQKFKLKYSNLNSNKSDNFSLNNSNLSIQKGLPFAGGDMLVKGIDALSKVLAKKIKEELILNALENIKEYLDNKDKYPYLYELEVLLPTTCGYLKNFDGNQLLKFSDDIKQYIKQDIDHLLQNAQNLRYTPRIALAIQRNPDLDFMLEGLEILDQITKIKTPVDYFEILSNSRNINRWRSEPVGTFRKDIADGLQLASMLAYSLTIIENGEVKFVTTDFIATYGSQENFALLYFGFLHQQNLKYYNLKKDKYVTHFVSDAKTLIEYQDFLKYQVVPTVNYAERIHNRFLTIKKKNKDEKDKIEYSDMHPLVSDIIDFGEQVTFCADWLLMKAGVSVNIESSLSKKLKSYFEVATLANDITLDLHEKRFTNALTKAIEIPLIVESGNDSKIKDLLHQFNFNNQAVKGVMPLIEVLSMQDRLSFTEKQKLWQQNRMAIVWFQNKISTEASLNNVSNELDAMITVLSVDTWNNMQFQKSRDLVIKSLINSGDEMLIYLGFDYVKGRKTIEAELLNRKATKEVTSIVLNKYDLYCAQAFDNLFFKQNISFDAEYELVAVYKTFLPDLQNKTTIQTDNQLIKFIHFVNDVAVADTPEAYEKAIETFVLPAGSSSLKEKAKYYYSVNSFPGILTGIEKSEGQKSAHFFGFTAPVGIYLQPWEVKENRGSWGLFLPIIDIAAPVRLRLDDNNDTQTLPDFELQDIISPGLYIVYGFKNSPFAINVGIQYGPKLRDIPSDEPNVFTSVDSYRIGVGATIDIPLITLASKYKE